jgi:hypothetical protein
MYESSVAVPSDLRPSLRKRLAGVVAVIATSLGSAIASVSWLCACACA